MIDPELKRLSDIFEDETRKSTKPNKDHTGFRRDHLDYEEILKKGELDRVIVTLKGKESEAANKLIKRFVGFKNSIKKLNTLTKGEDPKLREHEELFDQTDKYVTRVIKAGNTTLTLSKVQDKIVPEQTDYEKVVNDLMKEAELFTGELQEKLNELISMHTTLEKIIPADELPVRLTTNVEEGEIKTTATSVYNKIRDYISTFLQKLNVWGTKYDSEFAKFEGKVKRIAALGPNAA